MTTHYSPQAKAWSPVRESDAGNVQGVIGYLPAAHGLTLAQNDIVEMVKIPLGAIVMECMLESGNLGSNVLVNVGDGDDRNRYINAANHASAALTRKNQTDKVGVPYRYTVEDTIDINLYNANPADNVAIRLDVLYICGVDETP
jgi:hypothetical protein